MSHLLMFTVSLFCKVKDFGQIRVRFLVKDYKFSRLVMTHHESQIETHIYLKLFIFFLEFQMRVQERFV